MILRGLFAQLGGLAKRIYSTVRGVVQPVTAAVRYGRQAGAVPEPLAVAREIRQLRGRTALEQSMSAVALDADIPRDLYSISEMPWNRPFCYTVRLFGQSVVTGRFASEERWLTFSRRLTPDEVIEEAMARFGSEGAYPAVYVQRASVIAASIREGEAWR